MTAYPELLEWLKQTYPGLANGWLAERARHGNAAPDLQEWLGHVSQSTLKEWENKPAVTGPGDDIMEKLEIVERMLVRLESIASLQDKALKDTGDVITALKGLNTQIGKMLVDMEEFLKQQEKRINELGGQDVGPEIH